MSCQKNSLSLFVVCLFFWSFKSLKNLGIPPEKKTFWWELAPDTLSELASNSNIVSNRKIASNQDIACSATLGDPAILCDSAMLSNPAYLNNPAVLLDSATLSNPAMPSNPATFSYPTMLSNADNVRLMSPSQREDVHNNNSTPTASNPLEGKTTAVIAVMRVNPKDGYTRLCSNKHCKQRMVRVLLDSGSDSNLIFANKDKPMLLP